MAAEDLPPVEVAISTADGGAVTVTLSGELDIANIDEVDARVRPALSPAPACLILDVAGLRFADSAGITLWLQWAATADRFELRHPAPVVRQVLRAMGLAGKLGLVS